MYKKVGLKAGLEIHQQLDTHKLFCECPSMLRQDKPEIIVKRKLYAVAGETGKIDVAAAYEAIKKKTYIYEAYSDTTCLVELDEEPPHLINREALKIALQISLLLNAKPLEISQIMRKTVIDGSNTTGFQRTLLIARDGFIEINQKKIGIATICLEEDAARIIKQDKREKTFRVDRLGIPLVEIATKPEIEEPEEAKIAALKIGEILRACKVKRGIGTIRQDVNLSIKGGARIEIKGVQEPKLISKVIEKEVLRQIELVKRNASVPEVRKAELDGSTTFLRPLPGSARMYPETDLPLVELSEITKEVRKHLPKLRSSILLELEKELSPELAKVLLNSGKIQEYNLLKKKCECSLIAKILALWPREISCLLYTSPSPRD